jgi:hypothetical protein
MVHSHIQRIIQDDLEICEVVRDADGDYPFRHGTAAYYVRVVAGEPVIVQIFSLAVRGVRKSARLLDELNSVNARLNLGRIFWRDGYVAVETTLLAESLDRASLSRACTAVGAVADEVGSMIATVYGGHTTFPADAELASYGGAD